MSTDVTPTKDEALEQARPLTGVQQKSALKVIENDYEQLASDIREAGNLRITQVTKEIQARYLREGQDLVSYWSERQRTLQNNYDRDRMALIREAEAQGVALRPRELAGYGDRDPKVVGEGREIEAATSAIRADMAAALEQVRRDRLSAERLIHIATLTPVTEALVKGIPSAQEMFADAMAKRQQHEAQMLRITKGGDEE